MALKKSELYSSQWESCDQLRGGMDASQSKDHVLVLLFMKYVSDKYAGRRDALIEVPGPRQSGKRRRCLLSSPRCAPGSTHSWKPPGPVNPLRASPRYELAGWYD
jgi:HsdM N-terminal domain